MWLSYYSSEGEELEGADSNRTFNCVAISVLSLKQHIFGRTYNCKLRKQNVCPTDRRANRVRQGIMKTFLTLFYWLYDCLQIYSVSSKSVGSCYAIWISQDFYGEDHLGKDKMQLWVYYVKFSIFTITPKFSEHHELFEILRHMYTSVDWLYILGYVCNGFHDITGQPNERIDTIHHQILFRSSLPNEVWWQRLT